MNVNAASDSSLLQLANVRQRNHEVQNVFSEVLAAANRQGFASAQALETSEPLSESVKTTWSNWFDAERSGRYALSEQPEALKQGFGETLARAHAEGGYLNPKEFLRKLTPEELQVVQDVQHLASSIDIDSLTEEGALNLLLPPAAQVDVNHDGLTQTGVAYGMKFPDSNTPTEVVQAWEEATAELSFSERMIYELQMITPRILANIHLDENGAYSHHYEPGDPEFVNPMADPKYSYVEAVQDRLDYLDFVKSQIAESEYDRQTDFWNRLKGLLNDDS